MRCKRRSVSESSSGDGVAPAGRVGPSLQAEPCRRALLSPFPSQLKDFIVTESRLLPRSPLAPVRIRSIVAAPLFGESPKGGWSTEIKPEDSIHALIAVHT